MSPVTHDDDVTPQRPWMTKPPNISINTIQLERQLENYISCGFIFYHNFAIIHLIYELIPWFSLLHLHSRRNLQKLQDLDFWSSLLFSFLLIPHLFILVDVEFSSYLVPLSIFDYYLYKYRNIKKVNRRSIAMML